MWDTSKPDGQPRRCLNTSKAERLFGFRAKMHFVEAHDYMAGLHEWVLEAIADPDAIVTGWEDTLIAIQHRAWTPLGEKDVVVVYREVGPHDGFVITAFMTSKVDKVRKRGVIWQRLP